MLKMMAGDPAVKQVLVLGLSFGNLGKFKSEPNDTYIRINGDEMRIPIDVVLLSGASMRALGRESSSGKTVFMISLSMAEIDMFYAQPSKFLIKLDGNAYGIPIDVLIFSGVTEQQMMHDYRELIGPETEVKVSPKLRN